MKVAVVFVLYKTSPHDLESIKKQFRRIFLTCRFFTIDNTVKNRGYSFGINRAIKQSKAYNPDIYVVANTDIILPRISENIFLKGLKYFDVLGYGMKQDNQMYYGGIIDKWYLSGGLNKRKIKRFMPVDFVSGSLMVVKNKVIEKIGGFDERFFMYYEDVDFCYTARKAGFSIGIDSKVTYKHLENSRYNSKKDLQLSISHRQFFRKYSTLLQRIRMNLKLTLKHENRS